MNHESDSNRHLDLTCIEQNSVLAYQALGACLSPYNDFFSLHTRDGLVENTWGCCMYISSVRSPFRKAHFTSMWCLPIALKLQWLRLAWWSPSLPLVQRSHCNICHEPVSTPWLPIWPCTLEVNHQQQSWSCRPTYTELASSLGKDQPTPKCCSSGVS